MGTLAVRMNDSPCSRNNNVKSSSENDSNNSISSAGKYLSGPSIDSQPYADHSPPNPTKEKWFLQVWKRASNKT